MRKAGPSGAWTYPRSRSEPGPPGFPWGAPSRGAAVGWGRGAARPCGVRLPFAECPAGVCSLPARSLFRAAAAARGNLSPVPGRTGSGGSSCSRAERGELGTGRVRDCGRRRRRPIARECPPGRAWGAAVRPCNSSCCPWLKIPPARPSPSSPHGALPPRPRASPPHPRRPLPGDCSAFY